MLNEITESAASQNEVTFELIKDKQKEMDNKLAQVETSEVLIDFFNNEITKTKLEINERID